MTIDKRQNAEAFAKHHVRTACTLVDLSVLVFDLFDVQPPAVMEAIIEETERRQTTGPPTRRVRDALLQYAGERLREAQEFERRLYHGITGE
jgi:MoxR-like ATPase